MDPHISAVAEDAFRQMVKEENPLGDGGKCLRFLWDVVCPPTSLSSRFGKNQSLTISGEWDAGKTGWARYTVRLFTMARGCWGNSSMEETVLGSSPLVEVGTPNAQTLWGEGWVSLQPLPVFLMAWVPGVRLHLSAPWKMSGRD